MARSYKKLHWMSKTKKTPRGGHYQELDFCEWGTSDHAKKFSGNRVHHDFCKTHEGIRRFWKKVRNKRMRNTPIEEIPLKKDTYAIARNVD